MLVRQETDIVQVYVPEADQYTPDEARILAWQRDHDAAQQFIWSCEL